MERNKYYMLCLVLCLFTFNINAFAAPSDTKNTCDYKTKADLITKAAKITARSEVVNNNGKEVFNITVYNVTEEFYVVVKPEGENMSIKNSFIVYPSMTTDQAYTFTTDNLDTVVEYRFTVRSSVEGCTEDITTFYLTKPRKNKHYNMSYCKYKEVADYYYCQEWVNQDFGLTDAEIQERIEKKRDSLTTTTTAYCPSCVLEEEQKEREQKIFEIKKYIIAGLSVGIVADLVVIVVLLRDLKKRGL